MELSHRFTVPIGVEETWSHFNDIASVAECFPGAQVTEADEQSFSGSVKVKLGPIALQYNGSGTFVEKDAEAHRFVVDAKGKDKRGNGTAGAKVTVSMAEAGGSTDVSVETDLAITGKPAQFGRGVMQDVSDKLLGQFVACLEQRLTGPSAPMGGGQATGSSAESVVQPPLDGSAPMGGGQATGSSAESVVQPPPDGSAPMGGGQATESSAGKVAQPPPGPAPAPPEPDALDLGSAVLPVLAKSYWKHAVAGLAALAVLRRVLRRS